MATRGIAAPAPLANAEAQEQMPAVQGVEPGGVVTRSMRIDAESLARRRRDMMRKDPAFATPDQVDEAEMFSHALTAEGQELAHPHQVPANHGVALQQLVAGMAVLQQGMAVLQQSVAAIRQDVAALRQGQAAMQALMSAQVRRLARACESVPMCAAAQGVLRCSRVSGPWTRRFSWSGASPIV